MGKTTEDLKSIILDFINDLRENVFTLESEKGDLMVVEFFFKRMSPESIASHVIKHVLPHAEVIAKRDLNFFLDNKALFSGLPDDRVVYYSRMISEDKNRLTDEDRKTIWEYFDVMIKLMEIHKKNK